jgi:hypothetical protein
MRRRGQRLGLGVAAVVMGVSLTGCSGLFGGSAAGGPAGGDGRDGDAVASAVAPSANPDKAIVKATFDSPIAAGAKVDIAILGLKVTGKLAQLTLAITPHVVGETDSPSVYDLNGGNRPEAALIDTVNLKRYVVVTDAAGNQLQPDYITVKLQNEQPNVQTYYFAAPPPNVRNVDLVFGRWLPFRDVPISR